MAGLFSVSMFESALAAAGGDGSPLAALRLDGTHMSGYSSGFTAGGGGGLDVALSSSASGFTLTPGASIPAVVNLTLNTADYLELDNLPAAYAAAIAEGSHFRFRFGNLPATTGVSGSVALGVAVMDGSGNPATGFGLGQMLGRHTTGALRSWNVKAGNYIASETISAGDNASHLTVDIDTDHECIHGMVTRWYNTSNGLFDVNTYAGNLNDPAGLKLYLLCGVTNTSQHSNALTMTVDLQIGGPFATAIPS